MKKVLFSEDSTTIKVDCLNNQSHVGFMYYKIKGHIISTHDDKFMGILVEDGTRGCNTRMGSDMSSSLRGVINTLTGENCHGWNLKEFYVFDTRKELYKWLAE